jgi:hypothetical protein
MWDGVFSMLLKFLDLAPRYLVVIAVFAAFLLFGPDWALKHLGVSNFAQDERPWLGLSFIMSIALCLAYWGEQIIRRKWNAILSKKAIEKALQCLHALTEDEKQILRFYITKQTKTNCLYVTDGVVHGLVAKGIIYPSARIGLGLCVDYNIHDFAWEYLNQNESLLIGTTKTWRRDNPNIVC